MRNANLSSFLQSRAAQQVRATPETPEARLLSALAEQGSIPLENVTAVMGTSPEHAVAVVEALRGQGTVIVSKFGGTRYLAMS